jgi:hypothetical protein
MNAFSYVDHLLRNREQVVSDLQDPTKVAATTRICFWVFAVLTIVYGLIMGSQGLMHGHPISGWKYALAAGVKLPVLFLLTLAICLPLLYVLNVLIGPRARFSVVFGILMASFAVTSIVLASCALILAFFMLSTKSYPFIVLLNTSIFTLAGLYGVWFLGKALYSLTPMVPEEAGTTGRGNVGTIITWWLITYGIVGTQMAWLLRPFIGSPGAPFSFFRVQESNFYVNLVLTIGHLLSGH